MTNPPLKLAFHGRIIDHLGLQMYQSPVAAVAEMIANCWDADAKVVRITLPKGDSQDKSYEISDDGVGMTFDECQHRFLNVGYNRRRGKATGTSPGGRPVLGRKGIGKFAGFGIARVIEIDTVSGVTGEHVVFRLDLRVLRGEDKESRPDETRSSDEDESEGGPAPTTGEDELPESPYVSREMLPIPTLTYEGPSEQRRSQHGTTIRLLELEMGEHPSLVVFQRSLGRRFLLHARADQFLIKVGDDPLPPHDSSAVEFLFPRDYGKAGVSGTKLPKMTLLEDGLWAEEYVDDLHKIKWQVAFYQDPITESELTGVAVFANQKLAQTPFFFNLKGGIGAQQGQPYLSGRVEADYLDSFPRDVIATERQRLNWELKEAKPLLEWGRKRLPELLRLWNTLRTEDKVAQFQAQLGPLRPRLEKLSVREQKTIESALRHMAQLKGVNSEMFVDVAGSVLTAWESGHLHELIERFAEAEDIDEATLVGMLTEADVISAMHAGDIARSQMAIVKGLGERIEKHELELAVRDYIAKHPFLISPEWQVFAKETRVQSIVEDAEKSAKLNQDDDWKGRMDLVLSSGNQLLVLEFMRPGLTVDYDHVVRYERYIRELRVGLSGNTGLRLNSVIGYLIADKLAKNSTVLDKITDLARDQMNAMSWDTLLRTAESRWTEFAVALRERTPADARLPE
ncbi:MAG: ATP-binding protein [Candidatus Dormiibacterota bacterium]